MSKNLRKTCIAGGGVGSKYLTSTNLHTGHLRVEWPSDGKNYGVKPPF